MKNTTTTIFACSNCGAQSPKWAGRCSECGSWGTLSQEISNINDKTKITDIKTSPAKLIKLTDIKNTSENKLMTGIEEIDRVFGNGITQGSFILIGGEPGIGKSTVVAQIANAIGLKDLVIYCSGEESGPQVKQRFDRLNCTAVNLQFISDTNVEKIIATTLEAKPKLIIIDSIQTVYSNDAPAETGSLAQVRICAVKFLELAKQHSVTVILIGHITKDGQLAGPKTLEHLVDTVIYLEMDQSQNYRLMRVSKNRFGSTNEVGIFEMSSSGFLPISNPAGIFLESGVDNISGAATSAILEGSRPFLVEVQALSGKTIFGYPQRKASGFDLNRLQVLAAVLSKRTKINLNASDIILNVVGGLKIQDPGLDLAVCLSIASSQLNKAITAGTIIIGEVGLGGEIRPVPRLEDKLNAATKLGFTSAIIPKQKNPIKNLTLNIIEVKNLSEALEKI